MDLISLQLAKNYANLVALGLTDIKVDGTTVTFTLADGQTASVTVPSPEMSETDYKAIADIVFEECVSGEEVKY